MKTKILSGSTLAAAAIALALSGVAATPPPPRITMATRWKRAIAP